MYASMQTAAGTIGARAHDSARSVSAPSAIDTPAMKKISPTFVGGSTAADSRTTDGHHSAPSAAMRSVGRTAKRMSRQVPSSKNRIPASVRIAMNDCAWRPSRICVQRMRSSSSRAALTAGPSSISTPRIRSGGSTPIHCSAVGAMSIDETRPARRVEPDVGLPA